MQLAVHGETLAALYRQA